MTALLVTVAVLVAQDPTTRPGGGLQTDPTTRPEANVATVLDGTWTVLAFERDGLPVFAATATSVTIRNGVATFSGGDAKTPPPRPMRLELGRFGRVRVDEVLAAPAPRPGDAPPGNIPPPAAPGTLDARPGVRVGNYALTRDYFVVSVIDARPGSGNQAPPGTGTAPGEPGSTANPKLPVNPAVVGTTGSPKPGVPAPKSDPGVRGDEFLAASAIDRASIVLILKRSGAVAPTGEKR